MEFIIINTAAACTRNNPFWCFGLTPERRHFVRVLQFEKKLDSALVIDTLADLQLRHPALATRLLPIPIVGSLDGREYLTQLRSLFSGFLQVEVLYLQRIRCR